MKQELLEQFSKETGITKPVDTDLDYSQSQYIAWLEQQLVNKSDLLQRVSCMLPSQKDIDEAVCKHYDDDDTSLAVERLAFEHGAGWCKEQVKELLSNCS